MAGMDRKKSSFLFSDQQIYELSETIDAPHFYEKLGTDLLESQAEVSGIIGLTDIDYSDVVYKCLISWRNAKGSGDGQCKELIMILKECGLTDVARWLQEEQQKVRKCLDKDGLLMEASSKIDGPKCYESLGLKLVGSAVELSNIVGKKTPSYKSALYQCLRQFRNKEGSSMATARKLHKILMKRGLSVAAAKLEEFEPDLFKGEDADDNKYEDTEMSDFNTEPEADMHV